MLKSRKMRSSVLVVCRIAPFASVSEIAAVTPEHVNSAAAVLLGSEDVIIAIVGDYAKVKDQLSAFKDITFLDPDGRTITQPP